MKLGRLHLVSFALVVLGFGAAIAFYGRLPDPVPIHWKVSGEPDGWMRKPWGAFVLPAVNAAVFAMLAATPHIAPARFRIDRFQRAYNIVQLTFVSFLSLVTLLALMRASGVPLGLSRIIHTAVGVLLLVLGNFMSKFTRNHFIGIRTPWTLASEEVWARTHRLGGRLFVVGGLIFVMTGLFGWGRVPVFVAVAIVAGVPWLYSFLLYRRLGGAR
jgi:uncharacterized membrane protein